VPAARLVHPTDLDVDHLADPRHIHVVAIDQFLDAPPATGTSLAARPQPFRTGAVVGRAI
jgi:hypothetical protein